jgi:hypothetical protein
MTEIPTLLDAVKYRKLDNGYTIKYHVAKIITPGQREANERDGFGGELFVENIEQLKAATTMLIEKYMEQSVQEGKK